MPVFKLYYKLARANVVSLIIYLAIFLGLCIILSFSGKESEMTTYQETRLKVTVVDQDHSLLSQSIVSYISKNHDLIEIKNEEKELINALYYRKVEYILTIPKGFEQTFLSGEQISLENIKIPDSYSGFLLDSQINEYIQSCKSYLSGGLSLQDSIEKAGIISEIETEVSYFEGKKLADEKPKTYYYFKFMPYILLSILLSGFGLILLSLLQSDNYKRMICSSLPLRKFNMELLLASVLFALGLLVVLILAGVIVYQKELFTKGFVYCIVNSICMTLVSMSIGCAVGFMSKNQNVVSGLATIISLGMAFLGGIFAPIELLTEKVQILCKLLPTYWYTQNNDMIFQGMVLTQSQKQEVYQGFGVQLLFAVAIFIIGLLLSKKKRESIK